MATNGLATIHNGILRNADCLRKQFLMPITHDFQIYSAPSSEIYQTQIGSQLWYVKLYSHPFYIYVYVYTICLYFHLSEQMNNVRLLVILHFTSSLSFLVASSRYEYLFLERFELSKDWCIKKQNLVRELTISRRNLYDKIAALTNAIDEISQYHTDSNSIDINGIGKSPNIEIGSFRNYSNASTMSKPGAEYFTYVSTNRDMNLFSNIENIYNRSKVLIVEATVKEVIMLQKAYDQNITEYSKGHLHYNLEESLK